MRQEHMLEAVRPLIAVMALSLTRFALCQTAPISSPAASPKPEPISLPYPLVVEPSGPLPIESSEPEYSEEGRRAGLEGTAFVQVDIAPDGTPLNPTLVAGIGLGLDEKALEAVRKWRFAAPTLPQFASAVVAVDFLLPSKVSRWHLVRAAFDLPEGSTRPVFLPESYPLGAGISDKAIDEGWVISAIPRSASVQLHFDIDPRGRPTNFQVLAASADMWGIEATSVVQKWRFRPGQKEGTPVTVPCTLELIWGQKIWTPQILAKIEKDLRTAAPDAGPPPSASAPPPKGTVSAAYVIADATPHSGFSVILSVLIDEDGAPSSVQVVRSLGPVYDPQAIEAVRNWRSTPTLLNGLPVPIPVLIEIDFSPTPVHRPANPGN